MKRIGSHYTYRCLTCLDTGLVEVFTADAMEAMAENRFTDGDAKTCAVPCNCRAGDEFAGQRYKKTDRLVHSSRFNPERMVLCRRQELYPLCSLRAQRLAELKTLVQSLYPQQSFL